MGYKINVYIGEELVDDVELDIEPDKVVRISVDKDQGEIASVGSPADNTSLNLRFHIRHGNAMTGEEAQAVAATRNAEAAAEQAANQLPPENPAPPAEIPDTTDGVVTTPTEVPTPSDVSLDLNTGDASQEQQGNTNIPTLQQGPPPQEEQQQPPTP